MTIALDIDGCISEYPEFFRTLSHARCGACTVIVLTNRDPAGRAETERDLDRWGVRRHEVVFTTDKAKYIVGRGVAVLFEDVDENILDLPASVCVRKVREPENFDSEAKRWLYTDRTGARTDG